MSKKWKLISVIIAGYLLMVLLFTAFSDSVFYTTQEMKADSTVYLNQDRYEYYFHIHNDDKAIIVDFAIEKISADLAHITVNIHPKDNHKITSLAMSFDNIVPSESFLYDDPSGTYVNLYNREIGFGENNVVIKYLDMNTQTNEVIKLEYWVDITKLDSVDEKFVMSFSMYMHENSLLKIWRYYAKSGVQLDINSQF
ncbi:MAG: hypothetical protein PHF74_07790 [Dehalococcoidales bacterium]|nr:hypothetical protein [Dehalococcoidales bacterium]